MSTFSETAELYTPITEALEELRRRQQDTALCSKVRDFFSSYPSPEEMTGEPKAVMSPALCSPNLEFLYFMDVYTHIPLETIFYEYTDDKFVHLNQEKRCLGDLTFYRENTLGEKEITGTARVVDFQKYQGKPMNEVLTLTGENLIDFHHRLLKEYRPDFSAPINDFSDWFGGASSFMSELSYLRYLGLFLTEGILFGNFTTGKHERAFTETKVLPAFRKLEELFGVFPLIVPIEPTETDDKEFWCYYPEDVQKLL